MSIFSKIETVAKNITHSAQSILLKVFGQDALQKFEADIETIFQEDVLVIFQDAILAAESLQLGGADKRAAAFSQIVTDLKTKGISLAEHVVNLGIELVVGFLKAKAPLNPATPQS